MICTTILSDWFVVIDISRLFHCNRAILNTMQNLNPGIMEWFGLERTLENIWFQPPAMHLSPDQVAPPTWPSALPMLRQPHLL